MGAANDHPTPVEIRNRLKWYILGKHSGHVITSRENTEGDFNSSMLLDIEDINSSDNSDILLNDTSENENMMEGDIQQVNLILTHVNINKRREKRERNNMEIENDGGRNNIEIENDGGRNNMEMENDEAIVHLSSHLLIVHLNQAVHVGKLAFITKRKIRKWYSLMNLVNAT